MILGAYSVGKVHNMLFGSIMIMGAYFVCNAPVTHTLTDSVDDT